MKRMKRSCSRSVERVPGVVARSCLLLAAVLPGTGPLEAELPDDLEYEPGIVLEPKVAMDSDGGFVIAWSDRRHVWARLHAASGQGARPILVDEGVPTANGLLRDVYGHDVSMAPSGSFVVAWESSGEFRESHFRLFDAEGTPIAHETRPNRLQPTVSMFAEGGFVLCEIDPPTGLMAQEFDAAGQASGPAVPLAGRQRSRNPAAVAVGPSSFVVASEHPKGPDDLAVGRFDDESLAWSVVLGTRAEFPAVAAAPDGRVAVVWEEDAYSFDGRSIEARKAVFLSAIEADGEVLRPPVWVNRIHPALDPAPEVSFDAAGNVVVVYSAIIDGRQQVLSVRYHAGATGIEEPLTPEDAVRVSPELPLLTHKHPSIATTADGRYVVAWETFILDVRGAFDRSEIRSRIFPEAGDRDADSVPDAEDRCPDAYDPTQTDSDLDGTPNACDPDADADGVPNDSDDCPLDANPDQADRDGDGVGDACDLCPDAQDFTQIDFDRDGLGTPCDPCPEDPYNDADGDGRCNPLDNCPSASNPGQEDSDGDLAGDACDNCPGLPNYGQADSDGDGLGDACEPFLRGDANSDAALDVSDVVFTLSYLFQRGPLRCSDAMDSNDDGAVDVSDPVRVLLHLFAGLPPPPSPWPVPGTDPTSDDLGCEDIDLRALGR